MSDEQRMYQTIEPVLEDGEEVLWLDRPNPLHAARPEISRGFFGTVFFAFALFWTIGVAMDAGGLALIGLPFLIAGAWMTSAPWRAYRQARATVYGITDQRALIVVDWPRRSVRAFTPSQIAPPEVVDHGDGTGDVLFFIEQIPSNRGRRTRRGGFIGVTEAGRVADALDALRHPA